MTGQESYRTVLSCIFQRNGAWNTENFSPVNIQTWYGRMLELSLDLSDYPDLPSSTFTIAIP
ncbi:uncharacterized protein N7479_000552 [Penicillium vulpinum]|uniref:uncharacterized protein n=1 Tax=Penicillium vulpinum TaxID=29845 RepID=UPI00254754BB|nr:uncharacterized protein N7479_000552 [Penicillium vulpinum]KAJ5970634.1 hypothetical protein N7479_000552 [Penicillium vulpinum]